MDLGEAIVVCIDNSRWMKDNPKKFQTQCDVIETYCKAKLAAHPKTVVALYTMSTENSGNFLIPPTRSFEKIIAHLQRILPDGGRLDLLSAAQSGRVPISRWGGCPNKKSRMLFLVGGLTNMSNAWVKRLGEQYIRMGIAVDVVNFYQGKIPEFRLGSSEYRFGSSELAAFAKLCNGNENSHFVEVEPGSCVRDINDILFQSILKDTPPQDDDDAAADDEAQGSKHGKHVSLSKVDFYKNKPHHVDAEDLRIYVEH